MTLPGRRASRSPGDDVLRHVATGPISGRWDISSGGRSGWQTFATMSWPDNPAMVAWAPAGRVQSIVGRSDAWNNADLLAVDFTRTSKIFCPGSEGFAPHSLYAY